MEVQLKDVLPNPFRRIDHYPINREKVEALKESIESTGFWGNVVARQVNGHVELAYGHHRLVALKEVFGPKHEVKLIIRDLGDEAMLKIMARENMQEWGHLALVEQETVRAIVEAYAEGKIKLPPLSKMSNKMRVAPSFIVREGLLAEGDLVYSSVSLSKFLGWKLRPDGNAPSKMTDTLLALALIEEGLLSTKDFIGLTTHQSSLLVEETSKAKQKREREAREYRKQAEQAERAAAVAKQQKDKSAAEFIAKEARKKEAAAKKEGQDKAREVGKAVSIAMKDSEGEKARNVATKAAYEVDGKKDHEAAAKAANAAAKMWETKALQLKDHAVKDYITAIKEFVGAQREALKYAKAGRFAPESLNYFKGRHQGLSEAGKQIESAIRETK